MRFSLSSFIFFIAVCADAQTSEFGFEPFVGATPSEVRFIRRSSRDRPQQITRNAMVLSSGIKVQIEGAPDGNTPVGVSPLSARYNYYLGDNPASWRTGVQHFGEVLLGEVAPGVRATFGNAIEQISITQIGRGRLRLNADAGADLSRIRVRFLNTGTAAMLGPGGVWFVGGTVPGVFSVSARVAQLNGATRIPVDGELKIEGAETVSIGAPGLDARFATEVEITFPNFEIFNGALPANRLRSGAFQYDLDPARNMDAFVARLDASGAPIWVTMIGGRGEDLTNAVAEAAGGVAVVLSTDSTNMPATSNAPFPKLVGSDDLFLAQLDFADGKIRGASYGGLGAKAYAGSVAALGVSDLLVGGATANETGFVMRWQMVENRRIFLRNLDANLTALKVDSRGRILYVTASRSATTAAMKTGVLSGAGEVEGLVATTLAPTDVPSPAISNPLILPLAGDEYAVTYMVTSIGSSRFRVRTLVAKFSTRSSGSLWNRDLGPGLNALPGGITAAGNLKFIFDVIRSAAPTTGNARITAWCPDTKYFLILASGGGVVQAEYVPSVGFDFERENERAGETPARLACVAQTAGRLPTGFVTHGQLITITGGGFGPAAPVYSAPDASGKYPLELNGIRVKVGEVAVPVIAVARGLVAAQVPYSAERTSSAFSVEVAVGDLLLNALPVGLLNNSLSLFDTGEIDATGYPRLAALNQDGSVNSRENPALVGSVVSVFSSGLGRLSLPLETGGLHAIPPQGALATSSLLRTAIGGTIEYLGSAPGLLTAVSQINIRLYGDTPGTVVRAEPIGVAVADHPRNLFLSEPAGIIFVR
jgi:uncharacterized protein (TIGR03437 family)